METKKLLTFVGTYVLTFSFICLRGTFAAITWPPVNLAVYEGTLNTTMVCITNESPADWVFQSFSYSSSSSIYFLTSGGTLTYPYYFMYAIDRPTIGSDNLVIYNATSTNDTGYQIFSTAGVYQCYTMSGQAAIAQLVVIKSDPKCTSNVTNTTVIKYGQGVQLTCTFVYASQRPTARFNNPIDAILTWTANGQPIQGATFTITTTSTEVIATSLLTIYGNYDTNYECKAVFGQPQNNPTSDVASNAPAYSKTCDLTYVVQTDWWTPVVLILGLLLAGLLIDTAICLCWCIGFYPGVRRPRHDERHEESDVKRAYPTCCAICICDY